MKPSGVGWINSQINFEMPMCPNAGKHRIIVIVVVILYLFIYLVLPFSLKK